MEHWCALRHFIHLQPPRRKLHESGEDNDEVVYADCDFDLIEEVGKGNPTGIADRIRTMTWFGSYLDWVESDVRCYERHMFPAVGNYYEESVVLNEAKEVELEISTATSISTSLVAS